MPSTDDHNLRRCLTDIVHDLMDEEDRRALRDLFTQKIFRHDPSRSYDEDCRLVYDQLRVVNQWAGSGIRLVRDPKRLFALFGAAGMISSPLCFTMLVHYCLSLATILENGGERDDLVEHMNRLDSTDAFGVFMITELGCGSSHVASRTQADYDPIRGDFILNTPEPTARKFMPNVGLSGVAKLAVVCARLNVGGRDRGVFPFVVPIRDEHGPLPGVHIHRLPDMPLITLDSSIVSFDQVRLPFSSWLADTATITDDGTFHDPITGGLDGRLARTLGSATYTWPAQAQALAAATRASVSLALRHSFHRTTMGRLAPGAPVIAHRSQQRPLLGALAKAYAITFLANRVSRAQALSIASTTTAPPPETTATSTPWASINLTSSLTKALAATIAERVTSECRQRCGALGMLSTNRFLGYQGLAHAFYSAGGDSLLILLDTARTLVSAPPASPHGQIPPEPGHRDLSDPELWTGLTHLRERTLHQELTRGLEQAQARGQQPLDAWNDHLDTALALARAHGAALLLDSFLEAVRSAHHQRAREQLQNLCALHALEDLSDDIGWFLGQGLLTPTQARQIPHALNDLCDRILPHALILTDAFEISEDLVPAPIAAEDYVAALCDDEPDE